MVPDLMEWVWLSEDQDLLLLEGQGSSLVELHFPIQVLKLGLAARAGTHITHKHLIIESRIASYMKTH